MKTNREYNRRFPWFSASLGVIALASVATLFVSGQLNAGQGEFGLFVTRLMDRVTSAQAIVAVDGLHELTFDDAGDEGGLVVSGYPSFASTRLPLVRDQDARAVRLVLTGAQDVSPDAVAALRVTVNGRRVMERVLSPGHRDFTWVFDLTEELAGEPEARVAFQLLGDLPEQLCHNDRSMGAVISFDGASGLEIELAGPVSSVRDVLALTPRQVVIAMDQGDAWYEAAVRLGARLARRGYRVEMMELADAPAAVEARVQGLILAASPEALQRAGFRPVAEREPAGASLWRRAGATMVALTDPERHETIRFLTSELASIARTETINPVVFDAPSGDLGLLSVEALGVDTSIQRIADSREWRFEYGLAQSPQGRAPEALAVDLRLPEGPDGFTNIAHVELNGDLIDSRRLMAGMDNRYVVDLPAAGQALTNELAIMLQRHRDDGGCEISQQRYPVQLAPDSGLVFGGDGPAAGFTALPGGFANGVQIVLPSDQAPQARLISATVAAEALALFAPSQAALDFTFAEADNGRTAPVDRPFLAVNAMPENAAAPLRVYADRLVMQSGAGPEADVRALSNLALLQTARARLDPERSPSGAPSVDGLIVHAIDTAPSLKGARFGQAYVSIVHADGEAVTPRTLSVAGLDAAMR